MPRIAGGQLKGVVLEAPKTVRPTSDMVRQAIFNILGGSVADAVVLDGYAGSGALGLEAISRGAMQVTFIESEPQALYTLKRNLEKAERLLQGSPWQVIANEVDAALPKLAKRQATFDLILLDPPYKTGLGKKSLSVISDYVMLAAAGLLCLEHARVDEPGERIGQLTLIKRHRYGETVLSFYRMAPSCAQSTQAPSTQSPSATST